MVSVNIVRSCLIISCAISHLGIKPVRGGRPLSDRSVRRESADKTGALDQEVASSCKFLVPEKMNVKNSVEVIRRYRAKFSVVS